MSETAIRAEGIGKHYEITHLARRRHNTLRDSLAAGVRGLLPAWGGGRRSATRETIWAVREVSFEIARGEVVGVIGGNGAGKSTLLKILSRITEPSAGRAEIRGRVGSLLEVGTGFHSELTGRENTYLSGAILGMRHAEIERKFDAIVDFAEVEQFLDTPVKHYSSGMYLRLAFAVAAHLDPEILLVDEVLAVGDVNFQRKCLGKMDDVARAGRTVLFVSHNMDAVRRLCPRSFLLERGRLVADGPTEGIVSRHLARAGGPAGPDAWIDLDTADRSGSREVRFARARYSGEPAALAGQPYAGGALEIELELVAAEARPLDSLAVSLRTPGGTRLVDVDIMEHGQALALTAGPNRVRFRLAAVHLTPGRYTVGLWAGRTSGEAFDYLESAFELELFAAPYGGAARASNGLVTCDFSVTHERAAAPV